MKTKLLLLSGLVLTSLLQSCVLNKEVYTAELEENFKEQKSEFIQKRGLEGSANDFDVYFSDETIDKEYEVVSYNQVVSWIPLRPFIFNKWQIKYRLHQYMHNAYCLGILPSIDGMLVDADLTGVKYIRYKDSSKEAFVIPAKQDFTKGLSGGLGFTVPTIQSNQIITGSYHLNRNINCTKSIRHEFGFLYGLNSKDEYKDWNNYDVINKEGGFFSLNYKYIFSYNVSEYFSNTWNKGSGKNPFFTEIGFDMNTFDINSTSSTTMNGSAKISSSKNTFTTIFNLGAYVGLRYSLSSNLDLNLGLSSTPVGLFNFESGKASYLNQPETKSIDRSIFSMNSANPRILLRISYKL